MKQKKSLIPYVLKKLKLYPGTVFKIKEREDNKTFLVNNRWRIVDVNRNEEANDINLINLLENPDNVIKTRWTPKLNRLYYTFDEFEIEPEYNSDCEACDKPVKRIGVTSAIWTSSLIDYMRLKSNMVFKEEVTAHCSFNALLKKLQKLKKEVVGDD